MTMLGHFRTDRGPGKGLAAAASDGPKTTAFMYRGTGTLVVGSIAQLDTFAGSVFSTSNLEGGDPTQADYPHNSIFNNLVDPSELGKGIGVLITSLGSGGGFSDTVVYGVTEAYDVDLFGPIIALRTDEVSMDVGTNNGIIAAAGSKIVAIPLETGGAGLLRYWFSGDIGFGVA